MSRFPGGNAIGDIWLVRLWLGPQEATLIPMCKDHSSKPFQGASIWLWSHVVEGICWSRPRGPFVLCGWFGRSPFFVDVSPSCCEQVKFSKDGYLSIILNGFVWNDLSFVTIFSLLEWPCGGVQHGIAKFQTNPHDLSWRAAGFACPQHLRKERRIE